MLIPLQEKPHILLYKGAFDPPHDGHLFVIQNALRQTGATFAIIMAHDQPNPHKANCSLHHHRIAMIEKIFDGERNVIVCKESNDAVEKKYLQTSYVSLLIGADVWGHFSEKKEIKYHQIFISDRVGSSIPSVTSYRGKPVNPPFAITLNILQPSYVIFSKNTPNCMNVLNRQVNKSTSS